MPRTKTAVRGAGLLAGILIALAASALPACAQATTTTDDIVKRLEGLEAATDIAVPALRQRAAERAKSKADAAPLKRPPVAAELLNLPRIAFEVRFDPDSSIIRPESYQTLGRIADALVRARLLPYGFLIVGHTESTGKRDYNLTLSQKRADSIRDALVNTFKISPKRLQALGLGEEQLQDSARPAAPINQQLEVVAVAKMS
jgi:outer membrane protein OmpA-like peptidoglycan-associated protein